MTIDNVYRSCVETRKLALKKDLFRIVRTPSGIVVVDIEQNIQGRGCYISKDINVILKAKKKNSFQRYLKCHVELSIYDELLTYL